MTETQIYEHIKQAINSASRNGQTVEMHLQMSKYADHLKTLLLKSSERVWDLKPILVLNSAN